ncbi:MAG: flagellar basal body P-ring protein FlgI [Thiobacillaceae bacterium]|nr:flagellar basal body P-ring protein FlgI [Thiobacillaceae bacterium]MCX7673799.1 flagellar basal body P-ring protein FlgI [Thiobacillaceae bacterium]
MSKRRVRLVAVLLALTCTLSPATWSAQRIKDVASVQGVRANPLVGYGLVVGLDGTGDQTTSTPFTVQSLLSMLGQLGVQLPPGTNLQLKNVAAVMVTAQLPPFARPGQTVDVTVSSLGNAKSLRGGTLLMTPLKGADGQVYAIAQGNVLVAGAGAAAGGSSQQINHLAAGRIPAGATVERAVPTRVGQGDFVHLELKEADFTLTSRVAEVIDRSFGAGTALPLDGRWIQVRAPADPGQRIAFLARLEALTLDSAKPTPKVIVNARTGSIVMNQEVRLAQCAVAHGNLSVVVRAEPQVSQPGPLSPGQTVVTEKADVQIKKDKGELVVVPATASLADVVKALNAVGATPQDLLAILQAMKAAGALQAELEVI